MNISAKGISFGYVGADTLLDEVSVLFARGEKLAIIGENGAGKSTLMKLLSGELSPDEGRIIRDARVRTVYVTQDFNAPMGISARDYIGKSSGKPTRAFDTLESLGFSVGRTTGQLEVDMGKLSGGQKRMIDIAVAFSNQPDFIFIDEPENHLDIVARSVLAEMMSSYRGGVMFVSHDKFLVDEVSDSIIEIEGGSLRKVSAMSYDDSQDARGRQIESDMRRWTVLKKKIAIKKKSVVILQLQAKQSGKNAPKYHAAKRQLEKMQKELLETKPSLQRDQPSIKVKHVDQKKGKMIVEAKNVSYEFEDSGKRLFSKVSLNLVFGERVAIVGRNGTGKSTLLRVLFEGEPIHGGRVKPGKEIRMEHFTQSHDSLDSTKNAHWHCRERGMGDQFARSFLSKLKFTRSEASSRIDGLSGGQKSRLRFALLFYSSPELVILDEPTNNLDPTTWELLLGWLEDFKGTLLVISHDRRFLQSLAPDRYWVIYNKRVSSSFQDLDLIIEELAK